MSRITSTFAALQRGMNVFTETGIRAAELRRLSDKTDVELQRMGLNRAQLVHYVFSGHQHG